MNRPRKVILCVDDSELNLSLRSFLLQTWGYNVIAAPGAEQALATLREGGIDLLLTDLVMPGMNGNELVRQAKKMCPDLPMLIVSGTVKSYDRASHADGFLAKGFRPEELLDRIKVMVRRKRGPKKALSTVAEAVTA